MGKYVIENIDIVLIFEEAKKRGIKVKHINNYQNKEAFLELSYKKHFEYFVGEKSSKTSSVASYAVENKAVARSLLYREKISVSKGKLFEKDNIKAVYKFIKKIGYPIVVKKNNGAHGDLVFLGIKNKKTCDNAIEKVLKKNDYVLVEKEFDGKEYRLIATRNKLIAATNRIPANIAGDGVHNIKELIVLKNEDLRRGDGGQKPLTKIKIDDDIKQNLLKQNIDLNFVPLKGKIIYLRKNSNLSTGGDSVDITDRIHPAFKKIAVKAIRAIPGLAYAGIDLMTNRDISKKPTKSSYIIIELNSSPGFRMHHFPYKGKSQNVAKEIMDILFPETKNKYFKK